MDLKDIYSNNLGFLNLSQNGTYAVNTTTGTAVWVFVSGSLWPSSDKTLKLSEVNISWGDILIIIKASTQQDANWLIGWAFV